MTRRLPHHRVEERDGAPGQNRALRGWAGRAGFAQCTRRPLEEQRRCQCVWERALSSAVTAGVVGVELHAAPVPEGHVSLEQSTDAADDRNKG